ncbi:hypothetical protein [Phyllobacterium leguminum]|uniref:hypothetical protein n=1 Tax=Phyllobacterium leguminum TaxID=314237 RepID=UPI001FDFA862|nr:hypothetical protein [Phyllobacterium leguminum]
MPYPAVIDLDLEQLAAEVAPLVAAILAATPPPAQQAEFERSVKLVLTAGQKLENDRFSRGEAAAIDGVVKAIRQLEAAMRNGNHGKEIEAEGARTGAAISGTGGGGSRADRHPAPRDRRAQGREG